LLSSQPSRQTCCPPGGGGGRLSQLPSSEPHAAGFRRAPVKIKNLRKSVWSRTEARGRPASGRTGPCLRPSQAPRTRLLAIRAQTVASKVSIGASTGLYQARPRTVAFSKRRPPSLESGEENHCTLHSRMLHSRQVRVLKTLPAECFVFYKKSLFLCVSCCGGGVVAKRRRNRCRWYFQLIQPKHETPWHAGLVANSSLKTFLESFCKIQCLYKSVNLFFY